MSDMTKLIKSALANAEPFLESGGELYKKFDRIEIKPWLEDEIEYTHHGLFKTEKRVKKDIYKGLRIEFYYGEILIKAWAYENVDITSGDRVTVGGDIGGIIRIDVYES